MSVIKRLFKSETKNETSLSKSQILASTVMLLWILSVIPAAYAEEYDLVSLYGAALTYDADYQKAVYERQAVDEIVEQANALILPVAGFSAGRNFTNREIHRDQASLFTSSGEEDFIVDSYSFSVRQPIYRYETVAEIVQAEERAISADFSLALAEQDLLIRLIERYLGVLAAQDATDFSSKEEEAVQQLLNLANTRFKAQLGTEADVLDAKARYSTVQANTIEAKSIREDAIQSLVEITGEPVDQLAALQQLPLLSPTPDSVDEWEKVALARNFDIQQRNSNVKVAKEEIRKQQAGHHPTLDFVLSKSREETGSDSLGQDTDTTTVNAGFQLNVPLFQGGIVTSRTRQARKLVSSAYADLDKQRRAVVRQVRSAFLGVKSALSRIESLKQAESAQTLVVKTRRAGFPRVYNSIDVVEAERDLYSVKRDLARANYDYILSSTRLRAIVGLLNAEYLKEINRWFTQSTAGQDYQNATPLSLTEVTAR